MGIPTQSSPSLHTQDCIKPLILQKTLLLLPTAALFPNFSHIWASHWISFSPRAVHHVPSPSILVSLLSLWPSSPTCTALLQFHFLPLPQHCRTSCTGWSAGILAWGAALAQRWRWQLLCGPFPLQRAPHCPPGAPPPAPSSPLILAQRREVLLKVGGGPQAGNGPAHSGH